jgi:hypothetical protein
MTRTKKPSSKNLLKISFSKIGSNLDLIFEEGNRGEIKAEV